MAAIALSNTTAGTGGFDVDGQSGYWSGENVTRAGDIDSDGLADLIAETPGGDLAARTNLDRSYVALGSSSGAFDQLGGTGSNILVRGRDTDTNVIDVTTDVASESKRAPWTPPSETVTPCYQGRPFGRAKKALLYVP